MPVKTKIKSKVNNMENCKRTIWQIIKIGVTYKKFDICYIQEKIIFNIIVEGPLLLILALFLVVKNLINYEVFVTIIFTLLMYEGCNIHQFFNKKHTKKERNMKREMLIEGIVILILYVLSTTCHIERSISITAYKMILFLAVLHWIVNIVLVYIFFKNK